VRKTPERVSSVKKPLALTLVEADEIIAHAPTTGTALGVNYVMRHHPAYEVLYQIASTGLFGALRTISFQNFAQYVPPSHWFWDRAQSGGILVEHGVHFFDAFELLAGGPTQVWGHIPRRDAVEVSLGHDTGVLTRYYHEFAFPKEVERATGTIFFEHGFLELDGWIPERIYGRATGPSSRMNGVLQRLSYPVSVRGKEVTVLEATFGDREASYQAAIVTGMRDLIARHRDPAHRMKVTAEQGRASLAVAIAAQQAADTEATLDLLHGDKSVLYSSGRSMTTASGKEAGRTPTAAG
jgi:predicted dehydrogenase